MSDEELIEQYSKEILGSLYEPGELTVERLIEHSRKLREINEELAQIRSKAYKEGYERGVAMAAQNSVTAEQLAGMTVQQFVNFIGTCND